MTIIAPLTKKRHGLNPALRALARRSITGDRELDALFLADLDGSPEQTQTYATRQYPKLASLISPGLRSEAAAARVHGAPLFPSL